MRIAFHTNQLGLRGTEVASFNYAKYNEELLNNESFILAKNNNSFSHPLSIQKFKDRFPVFLYDNFSDAEKWMDTHKIDMFYAIKAGERDGVISKSRKNAIHAVFKVHQPHGDVYAYISKWLSDTMTAGKAKWVPRLIELPYTDEDLRSELGISKNAIVFGRHGGLDTFDLKFVQKEVYNISLKNPNIYFLFLNTNKFCSNIKNIIHLPGTSDMIYKRKFINTCDAMLHARSRGESFGQAIAEFSVCNKPILVWNAGMDKNHLRMLKDVGHFYNNQQQLIELILDFKCMHSNYDVYSKQYSAEPVMKKFKNVFIDD